MSIVGKHNKNDQVNVFQKQIHVCDKSKYDNQTKNNHGSVMSKFI